MFKQKVVQKIARSLNKQNIYSYKINNSLIDKTSPLFSFKNFNFLESFGSFDLFFLEHKHLPTVANIVELKKN